MRYIATIKTNNYCNWKDTIDITVNEDLEAAFKIKNDYLDINQNEAFFTDQSKGKIAKWIWDFGDGSTDFQVNPSHNYNDLGTYIVTLQIYDQAGCTDTISKRIKVDYFTIYAANAFTPNNDGKNDVFYAYGNNITKFNMKIFNRWGEQIFESNSLQDGWDGGNSQIDTYVYLITYTLENKANSERTITGIVNLVR
jgi:gliding motility-associated-like protein